MTQIAQYRRIQCGTVWGGVSGLDLDVSTKGIRASVYSSASDGDIGGDIYYFSVCNWDMLTRIVVADVRGHGEGVSTLSAWVYDLVQERINSLNGASLLEDLNRLVVQQGFTAMTTAAVVSYYAGDSTLNYCYAGHPPLLLNRRGATNWESLSPVRDAEQTNLPLGILPSAQYTQEQTQLWPGDRILLYTDGVTDCPSPKKEDFGKTRLADVLQANHDRTLPDIRSTLLQSLRRHSGGPLSHDDVTFMLVETCN